MSIAAVVLSLIAIFMALFKEDIQARWRAPRLKIELASSEGAAATVFVHVPMKLGVTELKPTSARWYHLKVSNPRRHASVVNNVLITLLRIESKGADGNYTQSWAGDVPMVWRNQVDRKKAAPRTMGTWKDADICAVTKGVGLHLQVCEQEAHLPMEYQKDDAPFDLIITIQARGDQTDSAPLRLRVFWDGNFHGGAQEMRKHFHVTEWPE